MIHRNFLRQILFSCLLLLPIAYSSAAETVDTYSEFDQRIRKIGFDCREEIVEELNKLLQINRLNLAQLFDTFYIPIQGTDPQKFHTSYDQITDGIFRIILDRYLEHDPKIIFVVAVDRNGYVPTHNSKYSKPLTQDPEYNTKHNRAKQLFNDRTGLAAARNQKPFLLQTYSRDTGEEIYDLSIPIYIKEKHWGAIRIGYKH